MKKYKSLILIGNGFDQWQDLPTAYKEFRKYYAAQYGVPIPEDCHSILGYMDYVDGGHDRRKRNAVWHISYFSNEDKKRVVRVMKDLYIKRYRLYGSIDECIGAFRVKHIEKMMLRT